MKIKITIFSLVCLLSFRPESSFSQPDESLLRFDFYGDPVELPYNTSLFIDYNSPLSEPSVQAFYKEVGNTGYDPIVKKLLEYKELYKLDDWLFYQLIRKTAQQISPKADNYDRYTLYKWFLLSRSGYDALLTITNNHVLFYVQCDENIYNIPNRIKAGKQYVCLNYHDYGSIDFNKNKFEEVKVSQATALNGFSYKITQLPEFRATDYLEKDIRFTYLQNDYQFKVKINPAIKTLFANYPVVDYESYFNIPLSKETYSSLIPLLKKNIKGMNTRNGVDYLMRFTRYAFLFETDSKNFGAEKRLSPEQTLLYDQSDCEDRAALFFYLVKEIYNMPMIVLVFPEHVTVAVQFDKPTGKSIVYNGARYSVCEPTPQRKDLKLGQLLPDLLNKPYEIVYAYKPDKKDH